MAFELITAVKSRFKFDRINDDNWVFKLFYPASFSVCLTGSLLCAATSYFGNPITCDHDTKIPMDMVHQYCWLHGSYHIPKEFQTHFGCYSNPKTPEGLEDKTTAYYQWVIFVLALNALLFLIPRQLWKLFEGGVLDKFGKDAKSSIILIEQEKKSEMISHFVNYFNVLRHKNDKYFASFVFCEFLNFVALVANFCLTNVFFGREFATYGSDVINYYSKEIGARREDVNPMCNIFPTKVSCSVENVGPTGGLQTHNGLCVLAQNIVNEKIFLFIWFWYVSLLAIASTFFIYRLATIILPTVRSSVLSSRIGGHRSHVKSTVNRVLRHSTPGDWFLLNQIAKNTNDYFFTEFMIALTFEMKNKKYESEEDGKKEEINLVALDEQPRYNANAPQ